MLKKKIPNFPNHHQNDNNLGPFRAPQSHPPFSPKTLRVFNTSVEAFKDNVWVQNISCKFIIFGEIIAELLIYY